jgi:ketosteroid isomerase-like protein
MSSPATIVMNGMATDAAVGPDADVALAQAEDGGSLGRDLGAQTMPNPRFMLVALLMAAMAGCSSHFDRATAAAALLKRDAEWADTASAGADVDKTVAYWSDDAVIIPPGQPVVEGKAAIRAFVSDSFHTPGFRIHWTSETPVFSPDGKVAYMRSTTSTTAPGPRGVPVTTLSRGITVWRLSEDGRWLCVVDIWNDPPTAPVAAG